MQKWLPDSFESPGASATAVLHTDDSLFESNSDSIPSPKPEESRLFLSESGFSGPEAIMGHLTSEERTQVFDLVEQDVTAVFEERESELRAKLEAEISQARQDFDTALNSWSAQLNQAMSTHIKETADASARLAIQIAEKVVRKEIHLDQDILIRTLETTLFKIDNTKSLTVNLNPVQAQWLESQPQVMEKLGVEKIVADRRVEPGGCMIKTEKQEWDATIHGQLECLTELVEEMITTADEPDLTGEDGKDAKPGMD